MNMCSETTRRTSGSTKDGATTDRMCGRGWERGGCIHQDIDVGVVECVPCYCNLRRPRNEKGKPVRRKLRTWGRILNVTNTSVRTNTGVSFEFGGRC